MKKLIKFLASKIKYIIFIYVLVQIVLILTININYRSDALYYYKIAQECIEGSEFYQEQAVKWITENPVKWISLAPLKFLHTYGWDDISLSSLLGFGDTNFAREIRILVSERGQSDALSDTTLTEKVLYFSVLILSHLFYYLLLVAITSGIYNLFKKRLFTDSTSLILLFSLLATLMIMVTVGTPRYKYPMFILLLPFAASYLDMKFGFGKPNNEKD